MKKRRIIHFLKYPAGRNPAAQPVVAHVHKRQRLEPRRQRPEDLIVVHVQVPQVVWDLHFCQIKRKHIPRQVSILYALTLPEQARSVPFEPVPLQLERREVEPAPALGDAPRELVVRQVNVHQARWDTPQRFWDAPSEPVPVQAQARQEPELGQGGRDRAGEVVEG